MMIRRAFSAATAAATKGPRGTVSLFQIPVNLGQPFLGPDKAPKLLLESGLTDILAASGWGTKMMPVIDTTGFVEEKALSDWSNASDGCHDVITRHAQSAKNIAEVGYVCEKAHKAIYEEAKTSNFILNLGGDHCIPIGTLSAIKSARPSLGVVWVDAHADINTPETSSSGNVHGMPVAFLMGLVGNESSYPSMQWFKPVLHPRDVVYIGLRDVDSGEKQFIKELGIKAYSVRAHSLLVRCASALLVSQNINCL
jgi:arginase